jgi:hypothetical protein
VVLDRMSHEVPYYSVYLKMAALQGTYSHQQHLLALGGRQVFGYAAAEKLGHRRAEDGRAAEPLLSRRRHVREPAQPVADRLPDVPRLRGPALHHEAAHGGGWKDVNKIKSMDELHFHYEASGPKTMMLQEFIEWDTYIRVPTIGRRWARAIRYDPAPDGHGRLQPGLRHPAAPPARHREELSLRFNVRSATT